MLRALTLTTVCLASALGCARPPERESRLSEDRLCEVSLSQQLHQVTDVWGRRYGVIVWCHASEAGAKAAGRTWQGKGEIIVTVSPANGETPLSQEQRHDAEATLQAILEAVVHREGWERLYPKRLLQVVP